MSESGASRLVFSDTRGRGDDVVLVHGWGMHGGFWREFAQELARDYRVTCLDLPGHGRSAPIDDYSPDEIATLLAGASPEKAHWIGWSLGATLVLVLNELFPERVKSLALIAGNPKFSQDPDWPHAMRRDVLDQFNRNLIEDFRLTLRRFLKIQTLGMEKSREAYRRLTVRLDERDPPYPEALTAGVEILKGSDLREQFAKLEKPVLALFGTEDSLVPVGVAESLRDLNPGIKYRVLQDAGHIPFISHREACLAEVFDFLADQNADQDV